MNFKKILAMAAALCMATVSFAACGDTSDEGDSTTTTTTTAAAEGEGEATDAPEETEAPAETEATAETEAPAETEATAETEAPAGDDLGPYIDEATGLEVELISEDFTPVKEFEGYDAFLMFADQDWMWGNWNGQGYADQDAFGVDADITGNGEYTVSLTNESIGFSGDTVNPNIILDGDYVLPAMGTAVFCVDITGICDGTMDKDGTAMDSNPLKEGEGANVDKTLIGDYTGQELEVHVTSIKCDGNEIDFDESKIKYGNIENNNNCYRIEIYNDYGDTAKDPAIDKTQIKFAKSLEVTFTIDGLAE